MNRIIIELDKALAKVDFTEETENNTFTTYVSDNRIEEMVLNFGNNIINSFSVSNIEGKENIVFKDSKNNSLTFIIQDENQEYGLDYISYLIDRYNEGKRNFYEEQKETKNINIALSTTDSYYEKLNDSTTNYVLYVSNDEVSVADLDFARHILEELIFNTYQNMTKKEIKNIFLIRTETHLITIPKILYLKINDIIKERRKLRKLAFKKEGN